MSDIVIHDAETSKRLVLCNPTPTVHLLKEDPTALIDLSIEVLYGDRVDVRRSFRVLEAQLSEAVDPSRLQLEITPAEAGLDVKALILPKPSENDVLQGRNGFVISVDREAVIAGTNNQLSHDSSPSVGAPSGAVCDNPNPTDGEPARKAAPLDVPRMEGKQ